MNVSDVIAEVFANKSEIIIKRGKVVTIRNDAKVLGTVKNFADRLVENRERALADLCKFMTGKRKNSTMNKLRCLSNENVLNIAAKKGFLAT
jgi:hypothetical protein